MEPGKILFSLDVDLAPISVDYAQRSTNHNAKIYESLKLSKLAKSPR